jgi:protein phosphatase
VHLANRRVFRAAESHDDYTGMGTTVVAVLAGDHQLSIAHVGDSRLYILSDDALVQVTRDDSWTAAVLGQPAVAGAYSTHPMRNVLTNVLGARDHTEVHLEERGAAKGACLLLCTDGLHGVLDDTSIKALLQQHESVEEAASALVRSALEYGSRDNVTALVARYHAP